MKISWFSIGRLTIYLRRIAVAQERTATAAELQADLIRRMWEIEHPPRRTGPVRKFEIGKFDQQAANQRWRDEQAERATAGVELFDSEERE